MWRFRFFFLSQYPDTDMTDGPKTFENPPFTSSLPKKTPETSVVAGESSR